MKNSRIQRMDATPQRAENRRPESVDLVALIDHSPLQPLQLLVIACCAAVAFFDGLDTQSIGVAAPLIAKAFHLTPGALGSVFSVGQIGAMLGSLAAGAIADRLGRKPILIAAILVISLGMIATAMSTSIPAFVASRLVAGLGLGAAVPSSIALTAEFAPARLRSGAVSIMWAAFPLGGFAGGLVNPQLARLFGWGGIFYVNGVAPLALAALCLSLPESLRYLASTGASAERIRAVVRKLSPLAAPADRFVFPAEPKYRGSVVALLTAGRLMLTLVLWALAVLTFSGLLFQPLWAPTVLVGSGLLTFSQAALVVAMANLGSILGTAGFGRLFDRFGIARVMAMGYLLAAGALVIGTSSRAGLIGECTVAFISCLCLGGASGGVLNLAAASYPTSQRSTAVGATASMGRAGQVVSTILIGSLLSTGWAARSLYAAASVAILLAALLVISPIFRRVHR